MTSLADAAAAPAVERAGCRVFLLAPLTLGDIATYERCGGSKFLTRSTVALLWWLSIRRHHPRWTLPRARRFCRMPWRRWRRMGVVLRRLNPELFKFADQVSEDEEAPAMADTGKLYRTFFGTVGWRPSWVSELTPAQISMLHDGDVGVEKIEFDTLEEAQAFVGKRQKAREAAA